MSGAILHCAKDMKCAGNMMCYGAMLRDELGLELLPWQVSGEMVQVRGPDNQQCHRRQNQQSQAAGTGTQQWTNKPLTS